MTAEFLLQSHTGPNPPLGAQAVNLFRRSLVWDACMPWTANTGHMDAVLGHWHRAGVNFVSLTVSSRRPSKDGIAGDIANLQAEIAERPFLAVCRTVPEIDAANGAGKLAIGFNFQETLPFGHDLENIGRFYELGVAQAVLAYNTRNFVADGCAEPSDAKLSLFGVEVIREMNRVGMLVDGSHAGFRSTMHAMEVCSGPFVFSHSNPFSVRPHYRSVNDEQIKACAATGGVVGINGAGYWVGDNAASTDAIFRCLDYTVELVGDAHVGLGFDYVHDTKKLMKFVREVPLIWPPYEGEWMEDHDYAGAEQMVGLVQLMLDHGYKTESIARILGGNWRRVCSAGWK